MVVNGSAEPLRERERESEVGGYLIKSVSPSAEGHDTPRSRARFASERPTAWRASPPYLAPAIAERLYGPRPRRHRATQHDLRDVPADSPTSTTRRRTIGSRDHVEHRAGHAPHVTAIGERLATRRGCPTRTSSSVSSAPGVLFRPRRRQDLGLVRQQLHPLGDAAALRHPA